MRSSRIYVGDLTTNAILNGLPLQVPLQGIALTKIGFGMRSAKFCGHIIFEFFNTICQQPTLRLWLGITEKAVN